MACQRYFSSAEDGADQFHVQLSIPQQQMSSLTTVDVWHIWMVQIEINWLKPTIHHHYDVDFHDMGRNFSKEGVSSTQITQNMLPCVMC